MKKNDIVDFIQHNKEEFQLNFSLIKPKEKMIGNKNNTARMINVEKYQTTEIVIDLFYKRISRTLE